MARKREPHPHSATHPYQGLVQLREGGDDRLVHQLGLVDY
jgi:hypothetical protein